MKKIILLKIIAIFFFLGGSFYGYGQGVSNLEFSENQKIQKINYLADRLIEFRQKYSKIISQFELTVNGKSSEGFLYSWQKSENTSWMKILFGPEPRSITFENKDKYPFYIIRGDKLWIFLPQKKLLLEQNLAQSDADIFTNMNQGITYFSNHYEKVELQQYDPKEEDWAEEFKGQNLFLITFQGPKEPSLFDELSFLIREDGLHIFTQGKKEKNTMKLTFFDINVNPEISFEDTDFIPRVSGNIRVVKDILIS